MKKWNVAVYLRLSVEDGKDIESNSILNQKSLLDQYIKERKDLKIYDYYIDDGYSGTNFERPDFIRMIQDVNAKKVDSIIVKDLSRFGRNYIETGQYIEEKFPLLDLRFISVGDNIDSYSNPESINNIIVPFKNLMNDDYSRDISRKIKSTLNMKKRNGEFVGALAPYGYMKNPKNKRQLVIDPESSLVVKKIFNDVIKGRSKLEIVNYLNKTNIFTPSEYLNKKSPSERRIAKVWTTKMIDTILKNRTYTGDLVQGKTKKLSYKIDKMINNKESEMIIIKNKHKPIISRKDFELANQIIYSRDIKPQLNESYDLFTGYLKCGDCNSLMLNKKYSNKRKSGKVYNYDYYVCSNNYRNKKCSSHKIDKKEIESIVLGIINLHIKTLCNLNQKIKELEDKEQINFEYELLKQQATREEKKLKRGKNLLSGLDEDLKNEYITEEDYQSFKLNYKSEIIKQKDFLKQINEKLKKVNFRSDSYKKLLEELTKKSKLEKLNRKIVNEMVDTIYIYEDNQIKIKFKYNDEYKNTLNFINEHSAVV